MWKNAKKFYVFIGVFIASNIILSIITGLLLNYLYTPDYSGNPYIGTFISIIAAAIGIIVAYKPFQKKKKLPRKNL